METWLVPTRRERVAQLEAEGHVAASSLAEAVELGADRVVIATDTGRHVEDAIAAMKAGLEVMVEKPLTPSAVSAEEIVQAADELGRQAYVAVCMRFSHSLNHFRECLPALGRVHAVRIECQSYLPDWRPQRPYQESYSARKDEGGVLRDLIHEIDYSGWLFGWPSAVFGRIDNFGRLGIESEEAGELLYLGDGPAVSVAVNYLTRPARRRMRASGENGTAEWDGIAHTVEVRLADGTTESFTSGESRDDMYREQLLAFAAGSDRLASAREGVLALRVCDAGRRSAETGMAMEVMKT